MKKIYIYILLLAVFIIGSALIFLVINTSDQRRVKPKTQDDRSVPKETTIINWHQYYGKVVKIEDNGLTLEMPEDDPAKVSDENNPVKTANFSPLTGALVYQYEKETKSAEEFKQEEEAFIERIGDKELGEIENYDPGLVPAWRKISQASINDLMIGQMVMVRSDANRSIKEIYIEPDYETKVVDEMEWVLNRIVYGQAEKISLTDDDRSLEIKISDEERVLEGLPLVENFFLANGVEYVVLRRKSTAVFDREQEKYNQEIDKYEGDIAAIKNSGLKAPTPFISSVVDESYLQAGRLINAYLYQSSQNEEYFVRKIEFIE